VTIAVGPISGWERVALAVEEVRNRLRRTAETLEGAGIAYAVIGGNAVAEWVGRVDQAAVRNTRDVDILLRRADFGAAKTAMEAAGFVYRHAASIDMFLDGPGAKARDAVHVIFAGERVRTNDPVPAPDVAEFDPAIGFRVVNLLALLRMKLVAFRDKDRTHIRDMLDVGLIDATWTGKLPPELAARLQQLLDDPDG
jgi:hypothetical protein